MATENFLFGLTGHFKFLLLKKPLGHHYKAEMLQIQ